MSWRAIQRCLLALMFAVGAASAQAQSYANREDVRQFVDEMVQKHRFASAELLAMFARVRFQPAIIKAMSAPAESAPQRSWRAYRAQFVNTARIEAGLRFRQQHASAIDRAAKQFGVPAEIIVAIIGVETVYGRNTGSYRVIDALSTLAFDFPARAEYFRSELENFLLHARQEGIDLLSQRGSYAGAIGIPQFMPGSYRRFAVDFDGDGRRDLGGSATDAIGSVANYLKEHGWRTGEPIAVASRVSGNDYRSLTAAGLKPSVRASELPRFQVSPESALDPSTMVALVELETPGGDSEYWLGLENFFVVTRYNRSSFYAMAVIELAREISVEWDRRNAAPIAPTP
jgi:membrane-bound lytic murein transglycosylase B